ncbi:MAG: hypothetical protein Q4D19_06865 [Lautropia sp.]|nr:hypothetical protein [Lautropia sp.]
MEETANTPLPASRPPQKTTSSRPWLTIITSGLAIITVILTLFGYGIVFGLSTSVGMEPGMMASSPFDLLKNNWQGVFSLLEILRQTDYSSWLNQIWSQGVTIFFPLTALVLVSASREVIKQRWNERKQGKILARFSPDPKEWRYHTIAMFCLLAPWVLSALALLVIVLCLYTSILAITFIPSLGYTFGQSYARNYVIEPEHCATVSPPQKTSNQKPPGEQAQAINATCVTVKSIDGKFERSGRLVFSTPSNILLFDRKTGVAERIPLATMRVFRISSLPDEKGPPPNQR